MATHQYAFILGNHPELSFLEIERVLEQQKTVEQINHRHHVAVVTTNAPLQHQALMERLGGTIKIVEMVGSFDEEKIVDWLYEQINTNTKFNFGFSLYPSEEGVKTKKDWKALTTLGLTIKKILKAEEISSRFVQSKEVTLSSVIVQKERLLKNGVDIVLLKSHSGIEFGKTVAVQPFESFSKRDYGRPQRDHRSGMLPPKVARMMLNIARSKGTDRILDPFCGSGTVLQEALLLGYKNVVGTDITKKSINDTRKNLEWLKLPAAELHVSDVRSINNTIKSGSIHCIVAEGYLGTPKPKSVAAEMQELTELYRNAFGSLARVMVPGGTMVLALPAWVTKQGLTTLTVDESIKKAGFKQFHEPLLYGREGASVKRHIHFLQKR